MRSGTVVSRAGVAAVLVLMAVAVGCGGHEASQERPDISGQPDATRISDEVLLPGDQRAPGPPTATTVARRWPIGKGSAPAVTTTRPPPLSTTTTVGE